MSVLRNWGIGLSLTAGLVLAIAWWAAAPADGDQPAPVVSPSRRAPSAATDALTSPPALMAPAVVSQPGRAALPPGVSAAQWAGISAELQARPDGAAELRRLASYLTWADALQRFRSARNAGAPTAELAREVEAGLDERLRQREVSAAEAQRIKSAVLEALDPDATGRERPLHAWAAATLPPPAVDVRQRPFEQRQAEIVAAWSARPAAARDAAALKRELDALRLQVFSPPANPAAAHQEHPK
jgi:hypothetical protein